MSATNGSAKVKENISENRSLSEAIDSEFEEM